MFVNVTLPATMYQHMMAIFLMIIQTLQDYFFGDFGGNFVFKNLIHQSVKNKNENETIKLGLLTNEIPPIVYGGVATWIVNFIRMFEGDERIEVIPIFLAYNDQLPEECHQKYKGIRVIENPEDIEVYFCGPPLMNQAIERMAEDFGVPPENVRFDDFGG